MTKTRSFLIAASRLSTRMMLLCALCAIVTPSFAQQPSQDLYAGVMTVEVFANTAMPVTPTTSPYYALSIYRLDAMSNLEAQMNEGMPQDEAEARLWVANNEARLRQMIQPMVASAVNGLARAQRYQIDRLPAVVINQRYVVFGYIDVDQALMAWRDSQN
ncbi:TIGR03757 family integrating conjugative element protein [Alcaligenes faecalis]|uniref:TIGR03757 family integrating conjugative element protein n=1 Tax=Alcaligenes faecalis TaxID=511 RepID=UPI000F0B4A04|nr:TIGR03757 family integrating conjugative element protein [Alcaligenes faecalis]AYR19429.1 TIGR03757 family integrating conjugative element protein [Alcaligenes faecalis]